MIRAKNIRGDYIKKECVCIECGNKFIATSAVYCSSRCKVKEWRRREKEKEKIKIKFNTLS